MGVTVVIASHDPNVRQAADRIYELRDGQLVPSSGENERPAGGA
jgi:ABC-type lipoprotein export system ATPase subunit